MSEDKRMRSAPAARNRDPILEVLRRVLPPQGRVLEIGCGTGEHAVHFAAAMPGLDWQPSDPDAASRESTAAWIASEGATNIRVPLDIDVRAAAWGVEQGAPFDAVISLNMIHIAPWECALGLFDGAARVLKPDGVLFLYGPFKREGRHTAPSNETFDTWLKDRDPRYGVRDLEDVEREAKVRGFTLRESVDMPANNLSLIFKR